MDEYVKTEYVIGILRIRDLRGNPLSGSDRKWEYAGLHIPTNPYADYWDARFAPYDEKTFHSVEAAKTWLQEYEKYLIPEINKYYDINTLGCYKKTTVVKYEKEQNIALEVN